MRCKCDLLPLPNMLLPTGLPIAISLLNSKSKDLRARGAALVRNLSVDLRVTAMVREFGAISRLVAMLERRESPKTVECAAGAVRTPC